MSFFLTLNDSLAHPQFFQSLKKEPDGLGEALGKASSANTVFGLGRWLPITGKRFIMDRGNALR